MLCGRKPVAFEIIASRKSVIGVAVNKHARLRVSDNLHSPALRPGAAANKLPMMRLDVATPPGDAPGSADSQRAMYRANDFATMFSSASPGAIGGKLSKTALE